MLRKIAQECKENPTTAAMAAVGASHGLFEVFVRPELTAKRMWATIGLGVLAYELAAPKGELLSEGCDRALECNKFLTTLAIAGTAAHLLNVLPQKYDPLHQVVELGRRLR